MSLISHSQLAANRRNAPLSKGTMSAEGKAAVKHNALRHGLTSKQVVLHNEDADAYAALREDLIRDHAPANSQELDLVDQISQNYWRLLRAQRVETELFESCMQPPMVPRMSRHEPLPVCERTEPFAHAFTRELKQFDSIRRYLGSIERAYYKAIETLRKLQLDRTKAEQVKKLGTVSQKIQQPRTPLAVSASASSPSTLQDGIKVQGGAPAPDFGLPAGNTPTRNGDHAPVAS